eukprot:gnl/TRDRNA2_/TRDRNA2_162244_c0_seq1.p1 gnl/TRDRNA2_/TRDRNA2_162244_c0~~gnl/TRDRNA2_/TRDRNA2_162244_c0_seq1.p1  ORF type:complete len:314 (+),score=40.69 gnl/TRDRNA2_/TRDRNA2_162244_c0_seq1:80-1021(+)
MMPPSVIILSVVFSVQSVASLPLANVNSHSGDVAMVIEDDLDGLMPEEELEREQALSLYDNDITNISHCKHTILLSPGRTATGTLSSTVTASSHLSYCGIKEFFGHGRKPNMKDMASCTAKKQAIGLAAYIHVKPQHIELGSGEGTAVLSSPEDFFRAARQAGFSNVVTSFRDNQLARMVSSEELHHGAQYRFSNLVKEFEDEIQDFNRAVLAAKDNGFDIMTTTFAENTKQLCKTSEKIAKFASCPAPSCEHRDEHLTDNTKKSLDELIGENTAKSATEQLKGTAYEWMLDLKATEWPAAVERPIPLVTAST